MRLLNQEALVIASLEISQETYGGGEGKGRTTEKASQASAVCIHISATEATLLNVRQFFLTTSFYKVFENHCTVLNYFQYFIFPLQKW